MRLIDADKFRREMWHRCGETDIEFDKGRAKWDSGLWIRYKAFEECIDAAPTIEPKDMIPSEWDETFRIASNIRIGLGVNTANECWELVRNGEIQRVKHGRWIIDDEGYVRCGACNNKQPWTIDTVELTNYCCHCGARMNGIEND